MSPIDSPLTASEIANWISSHMTRSLGPRTCHPGIRGSEYPGPRFRWCFLGPGSRLSALTRSGRDDRWSEITRRGYDLTQNAYGSPSPRWGGVRGGVKMKGLHLT